MPTNPWSLCFSNNILESPARILFILCFLCTSQLGYLSFFLVCFSPVGHLALCGAVLVVTVVCKDATKQHKAGEPLTTNYHSAPDKKSPAFRKQILSSSSQDEVGIVLVGYFYPFLLGDQWVGDSAFFPAVFTELSSRIASSVDMHWKLLEQWPFVFHVTSLKE